MISLLKYLLELVMGLLVELRDIIVGILLSFLKVFAFIPFICILIYKFFSRRYFKGDIVIYTHNGFATTVRKSKVIGYSFYNGDLNYLLESERVHKTEKLGDTYIFTSNPEDLSMDSLNYSRRIKTPFYIKLYKRLFR